MQGPPLNTRRGRRPRRPQKRHPVGVPFCYSSSEGAKLSLAVRPGIIKHKKRYTPQKSNLYYPSRGSGRNIYLSPAAAGGIYFVRADRRGLIKHKKRKAQRESKLYSPHPRQGVGQLKSKKKGPAGKQSLFTPPPPGGGIIKGKKRKAHWAFLFFEFN